jgi:hypothetical protein
MTTEYIPPKVWAVDDKNGGAFASINRPVSGATHEKALPVGVHPLQLYSMGTPNGQKITILLEELLALGIKEAEYDAYLIHIIQGDQFSTGFVDINPNSKIPALVDRSGDTPINVFESGAILLYLAEKFGRLFAKKRCSSRYGIKLALLATRLSTLFGGRFWSLLCLCAPKDWNMRLTVLRWKLNAS